MFTKELKQGSHVRRFSISEAQDEGWEVREEADSEVIRSDRYRDWHRVERARMRIDAQVTDLESRGWR
jgi:hypothetical protein